MGGEGGLDRAKEKSLDLKKSRQCLRISGCLLTSGVCRRRKSNTILQWGENEKASAVAVLGVPESDQGGRKNPFERQCRVSGLSTSAVR